MTTSNITSCIVKPTTIHRLPIYPSLSSSLSLHSLDLVSGPTHICNHRFFPPPPSSLPFSEIIENLKKSLAEALELYPPVAGTVRKKESEDEKEKEEIEIALNSEGAPFIVEIKDTKFEGDGEYITPRPGFLLPIPCPVFAVKVTQFSCGTITVCSSMHHWATDLAGYVSFLELWATISRNQEFNTQLLPRDWTHIPGRFFKSVPEYNNISSPPRVPKGYKIPLSPEIPVFSPAEAQEWKISETAMQNLKNDFSPKDGKGWISAGDAITSLLWGAVTRARESAGVPHENGFGRTKVEEGIETIAVAADGRERSPQKGMVGQYFGNFNLLFMSSVPRPDLVSTEFEGSGRVALALRQSINEELSLEAVCNKLRFMEVPEHRGRIAWSADFVITNWCKFDLEGERMDFGWGTPFEATAGGGMVPGGFARLLEKKNISEIKILVSVEKEGAVALRNDPLLNKYATFVKIIN